MRRLSKLVLLAVAVAAAPMPVLAQSWPATVVAAAPQIADRARPILVSRRLPTTMISTERTGETVNLRPLALRLDAAAPDEAPEIPVRAKDEWSADEGLSVKGARLAYKQRF